MTFYLSNAPSVPLYQYAVMESRHPTGGGGYTSAEDSLMTNPLKSKNTRAYIFTQLLFLKAAERLHKIVSAIQREGVELLNIAHALGVFIPLCLTRNYLANSLYLQEMAKHGSPLTWEVLFGFLAVYWLFTMIFGGPPSALINHEGHLRAWTIARLIGNTIGTITWAEMVFLYTQHGLSGGTITYGFIVAANFSMGWKAAKSCVEDQQRLAYEIERMRNVGRTGNAMANA